ncbi:TonB-dependent siderophore receptor [Undibacterium sp. YM2]|uniref:TonB-dependent receptor plug domain-containing protein n=1 Tax=Undibacterium sp. YM2 TaxID=2058625 RepID=UPI00138A3293|nr:TonB-dependent receptor [Undibacterium sp. YM2]
MQTHSLAIRPTILSLAIMAAFSQSSYAQTTAPATPAKAETAEKADAKAAEPKIQKVEVQGNRVYDERRQDTASKIVVTQEEILRYGDTTVSEVLKRLPGVTIGGVQGRGGDIRMRGLGAGYTQIMLNGEPSPPGFSLDSLSPDLIERIEVIRAATADLSTASIAGTINIVLRKTVQTAQKELKLGLFEDGGKFGENVNYQISDKAGRMSYSISGNLNHGKYERPSYSDEVRMDANGNPYVKTQTYNLGWGTFNNVGFSPRVNWNFENGDTLTTQSFVNANRFDGYSSDVRTATVIGILPKPLEEKDVLPMYASDFQKIHSDFAMLRTNLNWIHKLADSAKLDVKLGVNYNKRNSDVGFAGYNKDGAQILDRKSISGATDKGLTMSGKYSAPFVQDHSFVFGWDGAYSKRGETRTQKEDVSFAANKLSPSPLLANDLDENFNADVTRMAVFAQDEWNVTKQWSVYGGLRWEGIDTRSSGDFKANNTGKNTPYSIHNRFSVWSPILQTLYKLPDSKNDQIRLGITRTYKAPDTSRLIPRRFISNENTQGSPDSQGNPNLKPELAWGLDMAYEHYLPGGGMLSASVFFRRINDITRTDLSKDTNGRWVSMPVNDGQATTKGVELEAKFPLRAMLDGAPAIDFRANVSFNWSTLSSVTGPNNRLDSQTPISANLGLDYKLDKIPLTLGGNASFQDGGPVKISNTQSSYSVPKRVLDVYALWKFDPKTNLRVSLGNLLHQDNINIGSFTGDNGLIQTNVTPTTVTARVMFEHKF